MDYDRRAVVDDGTEWVVDEVLTKEVKAALDDFTQTLLREGQKTHKVLEKQLQWAVKNVQGGETIQSNTRGFRKVVARAVLKHISTTFGDDALAQVLAQALATGDYLY